MKVEYHAWMLAFLLFSADTLHHSPQLAAQTTGAESQAVSQNPTETILYGPFPVRDRDLWNPPESVIFRGKIEDFDGKHLTFIDAQGAAHKLDSNRAERVEIQWANESARTAHQLFQSRKYREAIRAADVAIKSGIPRWQQRFLIAELVESADALGNTKSAGVLFGNLAATNPPAMLYAVMPLCWTTREPDAELKQAATQWLADPGDAMELLGASWLLFGTESDEAKRRLIQLEQSESMPIARLATAQLWRLVPPPEMKSNLGAWFDFRDRLLQPLQIGPTEFLADRLSRVSMSDLALGEWTRIATAHNERYHRALQSLNSAQQLLQRENRTEEAKRLAAWIDQLQRPAPAN